MTDSFNVLLVEDDEDYIPFFIDLVKSLKWKQLQVVVVNNGEEALEVLKKKDPYEKESMFHLVFLDLYMPKKSGLEFLLEWDQFFPPILVFSEFEIPQQEKKLLYETGKIAAVIEKPKSSSDLKKILTFFSEFVSY